VPPPLSFQPNEVISSLRGVAIAHSTATANATVSMSVIVEHWMYHR
jgi:hypothetical protein